MICALQLRALLLLWWAISIFALGNDLLSCDATSPAASGYHCDKNKSRYCSAFALLYSNSHYSSLTNLSSYLGINRLRLSEANGFLANTDLLPLNHPLLIPIDCKCGNGGFYGADLTKTTLRGESFYEIAKSLEGLTTCKAIREKNLKLSPWDLKERLRLLVPLRCACPTEAQPRKIILSYPVSEGDTIAELAIKFNTTPQSIIAANSESEVGFKPEAFTSSPTLLIPIEGKPILVSQAKPQNHHKRKHKMGLIGVYIAVSVIAFAAAIAIAASFVFFHWKRKMVSSSKDINGDLELQRLDLSVRTGSENKVSFERSQDHLDLTPRKPSICTYTIEDLNRATEDFISSNHIEGSVFHGRLNGKNLAIKRIETSNIPRIDFSQFVDSVHLHPNIIRLLGTCLTEGPNSFLVFDYAKNGSLKDWLHGGLAMKNQFIASCYCFLSWDQRLKICLGVASALQFMHQIMDPPYVHHNIKSRNIFLDEDFNAKVGNFGMAKCIKCNTTEDDEQSYLTHPNSWNRGYLAPEYSEEHSNVSPSIDIFAFGVVLLEILSGQTPITRDNGKGEGKMRLSEKIKIILESENADELREWIDSALGEDYPFDAAVTLANLARSCVEDDPSLRPNAGEIVDKLSRLVEELPQGEQFPVCDSTCKPLVKAAASST